MKLKIILPLIIFLIGFSIYLKYVKFYVKKSNIEVVVLHKFRIKNLDEKQPKFKNYFFVQALNEVDDSVVNIEEHSYIRNSQTCNNTGSIKSKYIKKTWINGQKFIIETDSKTWSINPESTRIIFKISQRDMKKVEIFENIILLNILIFIIGFEFLIINVLIFIYKMFKYNK